MCALHLGAVSDGLQDAGLGGGCRRVRYVRCVRFERRRPGQTPPPQRRVGNAFPQKQVTLDITGRDGRGRHGPVVGAARFVAGGHIGGGCDSGVVLGRGRSLRASRERARMFIVPLQKFRAAARDLVWFVF